ncbi:MAG: hypothetical protein Q8M15_02375 [Bacteroidota bacterium]|nr:hypothetical protein [Bacteroidota bacterium]
MIKKLIFIGILILSCTCGFSSNLDSDSSRTDDSINFEIDKPYFYQGYSYGSQINFNPLTVVLNRGFEMLRITSGQLYYNPAIAGYKFNNIIENLSHPFRYVKVYGTADFFKEQVIPFGNPDKPYWYPNYTLHLLAGGITYTGLKEWFEFNKIPYPKMLSAVTLLGSALINESVEEKLKNPGFRLNVDAVADVLIFDLGGILLFQSKKVNRFFSKTLNMRDWSKQPMFVFPGINLANCGQFISLKWKLPGLKNIYFFSMIGLGGMGGLSYKFSDQTGLSIGFGQGPKRKDNELFGLPIDVSLVPMGGIYYDKNNSLLASLEFSNSKNDVYHNYFAELNIYPGFIPVKKIDPSLWLAFARDGNVLFGICTKYTLGLGVGMR